MKKTIVVLFFLAFALMAFVPALASGQLFADVPLGYWAEMEIKQIYAAGITSGCATNPLRYCPESYVTRAEIAIFVLRGEHTSDYTPPAYSGIFADVPSSHWAARWIEQMYREGITSGCAVNPLRYCPTGIVSQITASIFALRAHGKPDGCVREYCFAIPVTRAQMATIIYDVFLVP